MKRSRHRTPRIGPRKIRPNGISLGFAVWRALKLEGPLWTPTRSYCNKIQFTGRKVLYTKAKLLSPIERNYSLFVRLAYAVRQLTGFDRVTQTPKLGDLPGEIARLSKILRNRERISSSPENQGLGQISKEISLLRHRLEAKRNRSLVYLEDSGSEFSDT